MLSHVNADNQLIYDSIGANHNPTIIGIDANDLVQITAADENGLSINSLYQSEINNSVVKIVNASALNPNLLSSGEASTILLDVSGLVLNSSLFSRFELVGMPAELIVISDNDFACDGCSFKGFSRVIIVAGTPEFTGENNNLLALQASKKLTVSVNGLKAPGVSFLDAIAVNIDIDGDISTNFMGEIDGAGKLLVSEGGDLLISSGNVSVISGKAHYLFATGVVDKFEDSGTARINISEASTISAGSISIESLLTSKYDGNLTINGNLKTEGDRLGATKFEGRTIVPDGAINIRGYKININGTAKAAGKLLVESRSSLDISTLKSEWERLPSDSRFIKVISTAIEGETELSGRVIELIAISNLNNYGDISGERIDISAKEVLNEGSIMAEELLYINGESSIINQFGGLIFSKMATLESIGLIMNGSNRPYRIDTRVYPVARSEAVYNGGTFETLPDDPDGSYQVAVDTYSANIIVDDLEIKTGSLTNINPYFIGHTSSVNSSELYLDEELSDQVVIAAANTLTIVAAQNVINSSAIIEAENGKLTINSSNLTNERYRIQVDKDPGTLTSQGLCTGLTNCTTEAGEQQFVAFTSPAGRINAGENSIFIVSNQLLNHLSFIEVWGDLHADVNAVTQYGFKLQSSIIVVVTTKHSKRYCAKRVLGACVNRRTKHWTTSTRDLKQLETGLLPALFSVEGYLYGEGAGDFELTTLKVDYQ